MPSLLANVRALPRTAWILSAGAFVNRFGSFVVPFLVLYLTTHRGFSPAKAGIAVSSYGLGALVASTTGGWAADRFGRRTTIVGAAFATGAGMLALSQARSLPMILVLVALVGLTSQAHAPAATALMIDAVPPHQHIAAFAVNRLVLNLGFAAGAATAGFLVGRSYFLLFVGEAVSSALFGLIALTMLPEGVRTKRSDERRGEATRFIVKDRRFLLFLICSFCASVVYIQGYSTLPLHVKAAGVSTSTYGLLIALNGLVVVLLELPIAAVTQRMQMRKAMVAGVLLTGFGFSLTGFAHLPLLLGATVIMWTLGEIVFSPVSSAYVASLAPDHLRGRYNGAFNLTFSAALLVGPIIGTVIYSRNEPALWALCALLGVLGGVCIAATPNRGGAAG